MAAHLQARQSQPPAQQQPPAHATHHGTAADFVRSRRRNPSSRIRSRLHRASGPASTSSGSTRSSPTGRATRSLDLKQDEFRIKEDGKPQTIESFSVVKIDPVAQQIDGPRRARSASLFDEQREAQRPDVRLFIILLDDYHVRRGNDMAVRKPLIEFIQNQLAPADMVAIMYPLTPVTGLTFTRNRDEPDERDRELPGPPLRLSAAQRVRGEVRATIRRRRSR